MDLKNSLTLSEKSSVLQEHILKLQSLISQEAERLRSDLMTFCCDDGYFGKVSLLIVKSISIYGSLCVAFTFLYWFDGCVCRYIGASIYLYYGTRMT